MDFLSIKFLVIAGIILFVMILFIACMIRREKSKRKVRRMAMEQKVELLNELAEPFGFYYLPEEDIFTSCLDAWQREQGYEALFDRAAAGINIVVDALPVYFDYDGKTWLIEFWKGQYGINTGGEVGVYHAKEHVSEVLYPVTRFEAVSNEEMPLIECCLERREQYVYCLKRRHWWLTGFKMGVFSKPKNLRMMTAIRFCDTEQAGAFYEGLSKSKIPRNKYRICKNEVYVRMDFSPKLPCLRRLHRVCVQLQNCFNCWLFRCVTHPFKCTADRMLFLYFMLPSCFRRMLRLRRKPKRRCLRRSQRFLRDGQQPGKW